MENNVVFNLTVCIIGIAILSIHIFNFLVKKNKRKDEFALGNFLIFIQSKTGFAVLVVVPCVLIMIYCATLVILNLIKYTKQKAVIQHEDNVEALREQMKAELLREMEEKRKQEEQDAANDSTEEEPKD